MKKYLLICLHLFSIFSSCQEKTITQKRIAILTPISHPSLDEIERGFRNTLFEKKSKLFRIDTFNAHGNKTLMRSEIEEIIRKEYDLVLTIGAVATQMCSEVFFKKNISIPLVFTCVHDSLTLNLANKNHLTGVQELIDLKQELILLQKYCPELKNLLLVFNPLEPGLEQDRQSLLTLTKEMHWNLITVEIFQTNELMLKTTPFMAKADALLVLKDNQVVSGIDALIKLCNQHRIPLMTSDLDSPKKGAAFGYGVYEVEFGKEAANKAFQILIYRTSPAAIPITPLNEFHFKVNKQAAKQQGVTDALSDL